MSSDQFVGRFQPLAYLEEFYPDRDIGRENTATQAFYDAACQDLSGGTWLEVGGGPTLYQLISAAAKVDAIVFSDYLEDNLAVVRAWLDAEDPGRWWGYIEATLRCEGVRRPTEADIRRRAQLLRRKVTELRRLDIKDAGAVVGLEERFDVVESAFCIDSITDTIEEWLVLLHRVSDLLRPGGTLLLCSLGDSTAYQIQDESFPAVDLSEAFILDSLADLGYDVDNALVHVIEGEEGHSASYGSLIDVKVVKS